MTSDAYNRLGRQGHPPSYAPEARAEPYAVSMTLFALFCCLPYVGIPYVALPSQAQPWAAVLGWLLALSLSLRFGIRLPNRAWLVLGLSVWFMLYVHSWSGISLEYYLRKSSAFLLSFGVLFAAIYISPRQLWRAISIAAPLWTAFALLGYASKSVYFALVTPFVPTALGAFGERGATSLAPEATDFGFTSAFLLLLALICRRKMKDNDWRAPVWPVVLLVFNVLLSLSGSGYAALLAIVAVTLLFGASRPTAAIERIGRFSVAVVLLCLSFIALRFADASGIRGADLLVQAAQNPAGLLQTTISYRIVHNLVGLYGAADTWFLGAGAGSFVIDGPTIYAKHQIGSYLGLTGWYAINVPVTLAVSPLAFFPVIIYEYGAAGIFFILLLFSILGRSALPFKAACLAMYLMTWGQGFPAAYPLLWLLLGLAMNWRFARASAPNGHGWLG